MALLDGPPDPEDGSPGGMQAAHGWLWQEEDGAGVCSLRRQISLEGVIWDAFADFDALMGQHTSIAHPPHLLTLCTLLSRPG